MATVTSSVLKTYFTCQDGKNLTLSLADREPSLSDAQIQAGVEAMLASGALASGGSPASAVVGAQKVDTITVDVVFA